MPYATAPPAEKLNDTADKLLSTAERCRRLSAWIIDRRATDALLQLAEECEQRAGELQEQTGERGRQG